MSVGSDLSDKQTSEYSKLVAVLQLFDFSFENVEESLRELDFGVHLWTTVPPIDEFESILNCSCQLWIISSYYGQLSNKYLDVIEQYFNSGKGVYILGNNDPYYADANNITKRLFNITMTGDFPGRRVVGVQKKEKQAGIVKNHKIANGLETLFEGSSIASIVDSPDLEPIVYGSNHNLVVASYDKNGKRAIIDGGFTRLYLYWDPEDTGLYVKNIALWLA